ncbi:nepenthesin [Canna indica]|uniref:Nepenthesin n=1 Tax=Canna indica TaxID=4628 RepID=A0AAQ3L8I8_9LILI|nr:nepenthesin [Canna indica]
MEKVCMLCILLILFSSSSYAFTSTTNGTGFRVRLIHRNSPLSPFHNPNASHNDEWKDMIARSEARLNYFKSIQDYMILSPGDIQIPLVLDNSSEYLMQFSIGTPPVPVAAIADTGSATMWIQALPCKYCYPQNSPIFDPSKSSTFKTIACSDPICAYYRGTCSNGNACAYIQKYADKSYSMGDLAYNDFTFEAPADESGVSVAHTVPSVVDTITKAPIVLQSLEISDSVDPNPHLSTNFVPSRMDCFLIA